MDLLLIVDLGARGTVDVANGPAAGSVTYRRNGNPLVTEGVTASHGVGQNRCGLVSNAERKARCACKAGGTASGRGVGHVDVAACGGQACL